MITLPGTAMRHIADFLDPVGCAKMAQTSRAWRTIAYRPSAWEKHLWTPYATGPDLWLDAIPSNARHLGQPTKLCFIHWVYHVLARQISLPRQLNYHTDSKKHIAELYVYWKTHGRPCIHLNHHQWADVFRGRAWLPELSDADTHRLIQRIIRTYDLRSSANPYAKWIQMQIKTPLSFQHREIDLERNVRSDVLSLLMHKIQEKESALQTILDERWGTIIESLRVADTALARVSKATFEQNERLCKKDEVWDAAAFHCGSSDDGPSADKDQSTGDAPASTSA